MSGQHFLVATNALTNVPIAELPVSTYHHSRVVNDNGVLEAQILLSDINIAKLGLLASSALEPGQTALYCYRDGVVDWAGLLWSHAYDSTSGVLTIDGAEFGSYLSSRFIQQSSISTHDVAYFANAWVTQVFSDGGPPLASSVTNTGTNITVSLNSWEQHCVADLLSGYVAQNPGGIDWSFDVIDTDGNGNPRPTFVVSAPRRGRTAAVTGVQWDYPGDIASYAMTRSVQAGEFATYVTVTGSGSGATLLKGVGDNPVNGYIKLETVVNDANLATQAAVNAYATAYASTLLHNGASLVFGIVVLGSSWFGSGIDTGDEIAIRITDPYFPNGQLLYNRVIGYDTVPATANQPELVRVTLGDILTNIG